MKPSNWEIRAYDEDMEAELVAWVWNNSEVGSSPLVATCSLYPQFHMESVYGRLKWGWGGGVL